MYSSTRYDLNSPLTRLNIHNGHFNFFSVLVTCVKTEKNVYDIYGTRVDTIYIYTYIYMRIFIRTKLTLDLYFNPVNVSGDTIILGKREKRQMNSSYILYIW